ncbi:MAG: hypothetical protein DRG78_24570 [Epsilonproteobacteria bacterium]|nr:MAG: hypothetical protein DRG78_24570 [Campylobacterota bacterium]
MRFFIGSVFIVIFNLAIFKTGVIEYFDFKLYDIASKIVYSDNKSQKSSVVVVDIDEKSLEEIGQWPWSRVVLAKLLFSISKGNPTSLGLDIIFPEVDKTSPANMIEFYKNYFNADIKMEGLSKKLFDNDQIFADSISKINTTMAVYMSNDNIKQKVCVLPKNKLNIIDNSSVTYESKNMLCNIEKLQKNSSSIGFINSSQDRDGVFRRLPLFMKYKEEIIPSLGVSMLMSSSNISLNKEKISIFGNSFSMGTDTNVLLNFYNKSWYKKVSAVDVLLGRVDSGIFVGKLVLLGTSAVGLHDRYVVTTGDVFAGINIHTTLIDNVINDDLIYKPRNITNINLLLSMLLSITLLFCMYKKMYLRLIFVFVLISLLYTGVTLGLLLENIYISSAYFLIPFGIYFFILNIFSMFEHYKEKQKFYVDLTKAHSSAIDSMALVVESRDTETGAHIKRTKEYIICLGEYLYEHDIYKNILTKEFRELVYRASPLHDIGKVAIPDNILKKPGKLTSEEFTLMKDHASIGKEIIQNALKENEGNIFLQRALNITYSHHEKWDGSGYPQGLKGIEIPLEARMMALADVYDALISRRVYKEAIPYEQSEQIILDGSGKHFDPILIGAFIELKDKFREIARRNEG